jgi:hypothetical protein
LLPAVPSRQIDVGLMGASNSSPKSAGRLLRKRPVDERRKDAKKS